MRSRRDVIAGAIAGALAIAACGRSADTPKSADKVASVNVDTIRVENTGVGEWGAPIEATEILRVPATSPVTQFGRVRDVAVRPDGGVLVFDAMGPSGPVLHAFNANGEFERDLGRAGGGPGEYASASVRVTVQPDGVALIQDGMRTILRYRPDGTTLSDLRGGAGSGRSDALSGAHGGFYSAVRITRATSSTPALVPRRSPASFNAMPLFHYDSTGALIDSVYFRRYWLQSDEGPWSEAPSQAWFPLPNGRIVVTRTDKVGFVLTDVRGEQRPVLAEVPYEPVRQLDEERDERESSRRAVRRADDGHFGTADTPTPIDLGAFKLASGSVFADGTDRIWIRKNVRSERVEPYCVQFSENVCRAKRSYQDPPVLVAFRETGQYLGEVRFPSRSSMHRIHGDVAWAIVSDSMDEQRLVKYRVRR